MTPAARLSATIEILSEIDQGRAADRVLAYWAKNNRYAGSKDRRAIQDRVFDILRDRGRLAHLGDSQKPRSLVITSLAVADGLDADQIGVLFSGERFAPDPLTEQERERLATLDLRDVPGMLALGIPTWLEPEVHQAFAFRLEAEMDALNDRAPLDLRVNTLKTDRETARAALAEEGIDVEPLDFASDALRGDAGARVTHTKAYKSGLVEIQDAGSQLVGEVAGVEPGERVVDLCAGGGGKALTLALAAGADGQVIACDTDGRRLGNLAPRADRAGIANIETRKLKPFDRNKPDPNLNDLEGQVDCVVLDAPCSGSGAWRRQPEARWQLTREKLDGYKKAQREVLVRGARLVRPGGRLVYITCSIFPSENEHQIQGFLQKFPMFEQRDWNWRWPEGKAKPAISGTGAMRLTPATTGTDGFYATVLERIE